MQSRNLLTLTVLSAVLLIGIGSCTRTKGCTDPSATNYNANAGIDNGTCQYAVTFYFDQTAPTATVTMNNQSQTITTPYPGGAPSCGAAGCANFSLLPGTYNYTGTSSTTQWSGTVGVNGGKCATILLQQDMGVATFYFNQNGASATVTVNGQTANVTTAYLTGAPLCGINDTGCASFSLPAGTYAYTASSATAHWSGNITITAEGCTEVLLPQATGAVVFWTHTASYGIITVNINGGSEKITSSVTGGTPACGFAGCANFNLVPGTYAYSASATNGATWNGNVTITLNGCNNVLF
jgi:hypothetical protein